MSLALSKLNDLRALIAPRKRESFTFTGFQNGIPRGAVTEISGAHGCGKTKLVLQLIAENTRVHVAWVEDQFTAYPCAFPQLGVQLGRVLFAEAEDQALWTANQMLRSGIFGIVVINTRKLEQIELRRLQLAAEQAHAAVIILSEDPTIEGAWPITLQLQVNRGTPRRLK